MRRRDFLGTITAALAGIAIGADSKSCKTGQHWIGVDFLIPERGLSMDAFREMYLHPAMECLSARLRELPSPTFQLMPLPNKAQGIRAWIQNVNGIPYRHCELHSIEHNAMIHRIDVLAVV